MGEEHEKSKIDESTSSRTVEMPTADESVGMRMEVPPWAEAYEVSTTDADGNTLTSILCIVLIYFQRIVSLWTRSSMTSSVVCAMSWSLAMSSRQ